MKAKKKFTTVPDNWLQMVGKHPVVDENTGEFIKMVTVTHWMILLLAKVENLNSSCGCVASNAYFAKFCNVSEGTVANGLSDLYSLGLLRSSLSRDRERITQRNLFVNHDKISELLGFDQKTPTGE